MYFNLQREFSDRYRGRKEKGIQEGSLEFEWVPINDNRIHLEIGRVRSPGLKEI